MKVLRLISAKDGLKEKGCFSFFFFLFPFYLLDLIQETDSGIYESAASVVSHLRVYQKKRNVAHYASIVLSL